MVSQPGSPSGSRGVFGGFNSTSQPGTAPNLSNPSQGGGSSSASTTQANYPSTSANVFGSFNPQASQSSTSFFGNLPQITQPSTSLFGSSTAHAANPTPAPPPNPPRTRLFGTFTVPVIQRPATQSSPPLATNSETSNSSGKYTPTSQPPSSPEPKSNGPHSKSYMDRDGDLCLKVGPSLAEFVVCSKTMARTSPFWKKMLYGEFAEGKKAQPESEWVVKLPDDNVAAMEIVLNIVHGHFDRVSCNDELIYTTHFYNICVLTDKYDMTHVLRPWAKSWSRSTQSQCDKLGPSLRSKFCHERLWIAWELGDQVTFNEIARTMILSCSPSLGNYLHYVGAMEPPGLYENMERARLDSIKALLKPVNGMTQDFIRGRPNLKCENNLGRRNECLSLMLGSLIRSLSRNGLWPIPEPSAVQYSVSEFMKKLRLIEFCDPYDNQNHHSVCSKSHLSTLRNEIHKTILSFPSLLTETHKRHLEAQAKKSGFA
ncbi:hypothetical protein F4677DRAFT_402500 [Hypoxylon crocopeplum]|nr:hypothetical protein F4677DRAFT_402500 [Hypoxylon crocopeplum]